MNYTALRTVSNRGRAREEIATASVKSVFFVVCCGCIAYESVASHLWFILHRVSMSLSGYAISLFMYFTYVIGRS